MRLFVTTGPLAFRRARYPALAAFLALTALLLGVTIDSEKEPVVKERAAAMLMADEVVLNEDNSGGPVSRPGPADFFSSLAGRTGEASYYGYTLAGNLTASGERFDPEALTAAHRTLPFGTKVRLTNIENGRSVVVCINDRGPFVDERIIDVSREAAQRLGMLRSGTADVRITVLGE